MKLPTQSFSIDTLAQFNERVVQEWIVTNGLGSYASATVPSLNTRKYHGLLVVALNPPGDRTVCLSKLDEDIIIGDRIYRLGTNEFKGFMFPDGYKYIKQFSLDPYPTYRYEVNDVALQRTLFLPQHKNAAAALYYVTNRKSVAIKVRIYPLLTCRHYHTVIDHTCIPLRCTTQTTINGFQVTWVHPETTLVVHITEGHFVSAPNRIEGVQYREERLRGEADLDNCFQPGYFELTVPAATESIFAITCAVNSDPKTANQLSDSLGITTPKVHTSLILELKTKENLLKNFYTRHPRVPMSDWLNTILLAADSFIVTNSENTKSIIAGYPWFEPWGRDTFIALPGLLLVTGRYSDAKTILQNYSRYLKDGLIPNFIADKTAVPVYNTVDGTLWYINAVYQYLKYSGDYDFVKSELWANLKTIIKSHQIGTMFGIHLDNDGLLMHGPGLTWMDAIVEGTRITPREGKAVEIQALWYNALKIMQTLANSFDEYALSKQYLALSEQTRKCFIDKYWNPQQGCLYDVLNADGTDATIRPNQVFAVSLDYTMLNKENSHQIVKVINRELTTPYGLRTLSPNDPAFVGKYFGNRRSRDTAYHNGTIWPWLLGPYVTAHLKVNDYTETTRKQTFKNFLQPLFTQSIQKGGLGTINEIYDGDALNMPRGCISQAWSVAEPLRAYIEDILRVKPRFR